MLRAQVSLNLENRDLNRQNLRSMLKISSAACSCLSQLISAQFALEMYLAARNRQKSIKIPILAFKVIQGHAPWFFLRLWRFINHLLTYLLTYFDANRKKVYNFLLVTNSHWGPISHRFWDTATYWPKIANFPHPLSFSAPAWGDPFRIYGENFTDPETRVFPAADGEDLVILYTCTVLDWSTRVTDKRTDGRTDRQTELRWQRRAKTV